MAVEKIYHCEAKLRVLPIIDGNYRYEWRSKPVRDILEKGRGEIRCKECHGSVRLHGKNVEHGPAPHAEHLHRQDSEFCRAGHYFRKAGKSDDQHRLSLMPVV